MGVGVFFCDLSLWILELGVIVENGFVGGGIGFSVVDDGEGFLLFMDFVVREFFFYIIFYCLKWE